MSRIIDLNNCYCGKSFQPPYQLEVFDRDGDKPFGRLLHATPQNLTIICFTQVVPARRFRLLVSLPDSHFTTEKMRCEALALWCSPAPRQEFYAGFSLVHLDKIAEDQLVRLEILLNIKKRERDFLDRLGSAGSFPTASRNNSTPKLTLAPPSLSIVL